MAGYTRQATFTTGNVISASDFTNEFDELLSAFSNTTGHAHDGTAAEGPVIGLIGDAGNATPLNKIVVDTSNNRVGVFVNVSSAAVEQVRIQDGAIVPVTDSDVDLGTSSLRFKDLHIDSIAMATTTVTDILDEDNMASNSATALATQQSIKAYVDANSGGGGGGSGGGSTTFVGLTDTPSSLSSDGGKMVKVNSGGTALEFVTANTDAIAEGSSNQYHTTARARAAISVTSNSASGNGSLTYNDSTGVFTFTPANVSGGGGGSGSVGWASVDTNSTTAPSSSGSRSMALGYASSAAGGNSIAIGYSSYTTSSGGGAVSLGYNAASSADYTIALGYSSQADTHYSVALGYDSNTSATNQLMLGSTSASTGFTSIRVGNSSYVPSNSMDLTTKTYVDSQITTNVASSTSFIASSGIASAGGTDDLAIGPSANTNSQTYAIAIGKNAETNGSFAIALGTSVSAYGLGVAIGNQAVAGSSSTQSSNIAVGYQAEATAIYATALGSLAEVSADYSTALGFRAITSTANQLMLGADSSVYSGQGFTSIRVGNPSYVPSHNLDLTPKNYVDTQVGAKAALTDFSVGTSSPSGGGSLAYNSSTGHFTYTPSSVGNRTFVRYSSYSPVAVTAFNLFGGFSSATYTHGRFMTNQTPTKADNSGLGITLATPTAGVEETIYGGGSGTALNASNKCITLTNNTGSNITISPSAQLQIKWKITNNASTSGSQPYLRANVYLSGTTQIISGLSLGVNSSGSVTSTIAPNAVTGSYNNTLTNNGQSSSVAWANGNEIKIEFNSVALSGFLSQQVHDIDFDIVEITFMYDSAVTNYNATTTDVEGIRLSFTPSSSSGGYGSLNSSPQSGDHLVGFYEGTSASTNASDYDWSIYAPVDTTRALQSGDILRYSPSSGWQYENLDLSPTSFSKFAAGTYTHSNSSSFVTVGTLMELNDGFQGIGDVIVSVKTNAGVETQKVNFLLTSSGVSHTTFATVSSTGSTLGTLDVVFSSANGGTALLTSQNASAVATTYTFHVTQL